MIFRLSFKPILVTLLLLQVPQVAAAQSSVIRHDKIKPVIEIKNYHDDLQIDLMVHSRAPCRLIDPFFQGRHFLGIAAIRIYRDDTLVDTIPIEDIGKVWTNGNVYGGPLRISGDAKAVTGCQLLLHTSAKDKEIPDALTATYQMQLVLYDGFVQTESPSGRLTKGVELVTNSGEKKVIAASSLVSFEAQVSILEKLTHTSLSEFNFPLDPDRTILKRFVPEHQDELTDDAPLVKITLRQSNKKPLSRHLTLLITNNSRYPQHWAVGGWFDYWGCFQTFVPLAVRSDSGDFCEPDDKYRQLRRFSGINWVTVPAGGLCGSHFSVKPSKGEERIRSQIRVDMHPDFFNLDQAAKAEDDYYFQKFEPITTSNSVEVIW